MQLKVTESILGFKHNLDAQRVQSKLEGILNKKKKFFENTQNSKIINEIIQKISEFNESNIKVDGEIEENKEKEAQEAKSEASKGLLLCGKKRKCSIKGSSVTKVFTPIDTRTLNHTERSFYFVYKQTSNSSEVLSDQMEEKLKKENGKGVFLQYKQETLLEELDPNIKYCICKLAWDGKTEMLACEGKCGNWYHPKCINISDKELKEIINSKSIWVCSKWRDDSI